MVVALLALAMKASGPQGAELAAECAASSSQSAPASLVPCINGTAATRVVTRRQEALATFCAGACVGVAEGTGSPGLAFRPRGIELT